MRLRSQSLKVGARRWVRGAGGLSLLLLLPLLSLYGCSDDSGNADPTQGGSGSFNLGDDLSASVEPSVLSFGEVAIGERAEDIITIRHTGSAGTLTLSAVLVSDTDDLSIGELASSSLKPGESTSLTVSYQPTDAEADAGTVQITTNVPSPEGGTRRFDVAITTLEQRTFLVAAPQQPDFGGVAHGTEETIEVEFSNLGGLPVTITTLTLTGEQPEDYALAQAPELPLTLAPSETMSLTLRYSPSGLDTDQADLEVGLEAGDNPDPMLIPITGHEIYAQLIASPDPVDFGLSPSEIPSIETVTLTNVGGLPLQLSAASIEPSVDLGETMTVDFPEEGLLLAPEESYELSVTWTPAEMLPPTMHPIATLRLSSNDPAGETLIDVFGRRAGAGLEVIPSDMVYFGFVGVGAKTQRPVTLYNAGPTPIEVYKAWVEGNFAVVDKGTWGPTMSEPETVILAPGEIAEMAVSFENEGGDWTARWGKLTIESNDVQNPIWELLLNARSAEYAPCQLQFVPDELDFGFLPGGHQRVETIEVHNIGLTTCGWAGASVQDCANGSTCVGDAAQASQYYEVIEEPEVGEDNVPPGAVLSVAIQFTAPEATDVVVDFPALLSVTATTVDAQSGAVEISTLPHQSWGPGKNVDAWVANGRLAAQPESLDFRMTTVGCRSESLTVTAANVGPAPVGITGWQLIDCSTSVILESTPSLDGELGEQSVSLIQPGGGVDFGLYFEPDEEFDEACALRIWSTGVNTSLDVPLVAQGRLEPLRTDTFTESESQVVDVLFVVDDSGSMGNEQSNLADSFFAFINEAATWDSDYQIGVTTTTVAFPVGGELRGEPSFVTAQNWEKFIDNVGVGTGGSGDEQGLWAAEIALSSPLTDSTDEPCEEDSDCSFFHVCGPDGLCGGPNKGFLRPEASLEIVYVSDEEDHSPKTLEQYLNFFKGIKGFDRPDLLHMHAIVGPPGGCSSGTGQGQAGHRYLEMTEATGGASYSICEVNFAKGLEGIGEIAFASRMEYFLTQQPSPPTIKVSIGDIDCPILSGGIFNWSYNAESNSVLFAEDGICVAEPGSTVFISYELLCYDEADTED